MRHWNDLHESLAAPSPIVPTCRTRPPSSSKQKHYLCTPSITAAAAMSATIPAKHFSSIDSVANDADGKTPLRLLNDSEGESHKSDEDVAEQLVRYLQAQSSASTSPSSSPSPTATTRQTTTAREMLKAGHRRLRQLAQRQKKETDPDTKAEEDSRQLSALQKEGLLPPSAGKKSHAKKESINSTPSSSKSANSTSRRDVERIGQPWLGDPLERCMLDPLASDGRLASIDLSDLSSFMMNSGLDDHQKQRPFEMPSRSSSSKHSSKQRRSADGPSTEQTPNKAEPSTKNDDKPAANAKDSEKQLNSPAPESSKPENSNQPEPSSAKDKEPKPEKTPRNTPHTLKLFPNPQTSRITNTIALRLSKRPPPNAPQPAGSQQLSPIEASRRNVSSPAPNKENSPKELRSAPTSTEKFANTDKPKDANHEQSKDKDSGRPSSLPMCAINAFPLPAPTKPLPSLPTPPADAQHDQKTKEGRRTKSPRLKLQPSDTVRDTSRPSTDAQPASSEPAATPEVQKEHSKRLERVRALKLKDMSAHRLRVSSDEPREERSQSVEPPRAGASTGKQEKSKRCSIEVAQGVSSSALPPPLSSPLLHGYPNRANGASSVGPMSSKHSEPMMAPAFRESQMRRSNSYREPRMQNDQTEQKPSLRSEYPIPSSDEEGTGINGKTWANQGRKKNRRTKANKAYDFPRPSNRVPRIEKPAQPESTASLSPHGRMSPMSQHSQCTFHSHDSHTLSTLENRIAQLERQNKVLQAALFAALDAGNKESNESILSGTVASLISASDPSSKTTPASFVMMSPSSVDEPVSESGGYSRTAKSRKRQSWLDTRSSSRRSSVSSGFDTHEKELGGIHDIDLGWLSDRSSAGDSLKVQF